MGVPFGDGPVLPKFKFVDDPLLPPTARSDDDEPDDELASTTWQKSGGPRPRSFALLFCLVFRGGITRDGSGHGELVRGEREP